MKERVSGRRAPCGPSTMRAPSETSPGEIPNLGIKTKGNPNNFREKNGLLTKYQAQTDRGLLKDTVF